ncbi:hypothetical protein CEP54_013140 [Fusarium duplospermum]|uniref:asparaginase n=1 Tax=Fusarium duplospermum TaxID=1325734 RepID=A0A428P4K1_9HYPO|nr:hypothetical protein CEP54_013140 [Fusarium duplospermum]
MQPFLLSLWALVDLVGLHTHFPRDAKELRHAQVTLPNITIIATGGTIAGAANSSTRTTDYEAGALHVNTITQDVNGTWENDARVYDEQLMNVDSLDINSSLAISISQRVNEVANDPHRQGIVVLLGTHLMSEIATLLALTVTSHKPIVITGAILPNTAPSADGPGHIVAAVKTAAATGWSSEGREVVIVMQDKIMAPWGTKKENNRFLPGPRSLLGHILNFEPFFRWGPGLCAPMKFNISGMPPGVPLPVVEFVTAHQDSSAYQVEAVIAGGAKGIVLVGYGDGYWPATSAQQLKKLADESDVVMVFAAEGQLEYVANARVGAGIPGGDWNPRQLRILLQLLIWKGADKEEIRRAVLKSPGPCPSHGIQGN